MDFIKQRLTMNENFLCFFMLGILGLGSLVSWGIFASFLVMKPLANLIHRCFRMVPGPKLFLVPGLLLFTFLIVWLLMMGVIAFRQHYSLKRFLRGLTFCQMWPEKLELAVALNNITTPIDYTLNENNIAFSYGLISPRIVISKNVVQNLDLDELSAILLHEESHSIHKDPLRIFLIRMAFSCFRLIKIIPQLVDYLLLTTEITADDLAMRRLDDKSWSLASALLKFVQSEIPVPSVVAGATTILENRINHLIDPGQKPDISISFLDYSKLAIYLLLTFTSFLYSYQHLSIWFSCH